MVFVLDFGKSDPFVSLPNVCTFRVISVNGFPTSYPSFLEYIFISYTSNSNCPIKKLNLHHVNVRFFTGFHSKPRVLRVPWYLFNNHGPRVIPACCRGILNKYHGTRKIHEVKNSKNGGMCEELDAVDEWDGEIKIIFRY